MWCFGWVTNSISLDKPAYKILASYVPGLEPGWDIPGEPRSQAPTKSSGSHKIFAAIHAVKVQIWLPGISVFPVKWMNSPYHTQHAGNISCHMKKHLATTSYWLPQEEISCHRKKSFIKGKHFLSLEEISCHRKKLLVRGRTFLSREEITCHRKKFLGIRGYYLSQKETSCHR